LVARIEQLDPLNPVTGWLTPGVELGAGQYTSAADCDWDRMPPTANTFFWKALALAGSGRLGEAQSLISETVPETSEHACGQLAILLKLAIEGGAERIGELLATGMAETWRRDPVWSYFVASFTALADQRDTAWDWLTNAFERGWINYPLLAERDPFLKNIRGEERFKKLMVRVKKEWEEFEV
jgi:hypothetical protein